MAARGFRSDMLRSIYEAAVKQGWTPGVDGRSGHKYLHCPHGGCAYRESFTITGRCRPPERSAKLRDMRGHGFMWQGRGGKHTAPLLNRAADKKETTA